MLTSGRKIPERSNIWGRGPESVMSGGENPRVAGIKWEHGRVKVAPSFWPHGLYSYTVHGILQARILEWLAFPFSRGYSQLRDWTRSRTLQADSSPTELPGKPWLKSNEMQSETWWKLLAGPHGCGGLNYGNNEGSERLSNWGHILKEV